MSFSNGIQLTPEELRVDHILKRLKLQIKTDDFNTIIHDFHTHLDILKSCELFKALQQMPKGGIHNLHLAGAATSE